jgi:hypothetical protein
LSPFIEGEPRSTLKGEYGNNSQVIKFSISHQFKPLTQLEIYQVQISLLFYGSAGYTLLKVAILGSGLVGATTPS